jgi:hypothetical protein
MPPSSMSCWNWIVKVQGEGEGLGKCRAWLRKGQGHLGYMCKKALAVAKGLSAGLLVHNILDAMSFSHSFLCWFASRPPVTPRYSAIVRVKDSWIALPNGHKTSCNTIRYVSTSSLASYALRVARSAFISGKERGRLGFVTGAVLRRRFGSVPVCDDHGSCKTPLTRPCPP